MVTATAASRSAPWKSEGEIVYEQTYAPLVSEEPIVRTTFRQPPHSPLFATSSLDSGGLAIALDLVELAREVNGIYGYMDPHGKALEALVLSQVTARLARAGEREGLPLFRLTVAIAGRFSTGIPMHMMVGGDVVVRPDTWSMVSYRLRGTLTMPIDVAYWNGREGGHFESSEVAEVDLGASVP
jgi:hypothetical protein